MENTNNNIQKKNNSGLIAILVIIILGLVIFILFDKGILSINTNNEEKKNNEVQQEVKEETKEDDQRMQVDIFDTNFNYIVDHYLNEIIGNLEVYNPQTDTYTIDLMKWKNKDEEFIKKFTIDYNTCLAADKHLFSGEDDLNKDGIIEWYYDIPKKDLDRTTFVAFGIEGNYDYNYTENDFVVTRKIDDNTYRFYNKMDSHAVAFEISNYEKNDDGIRVFGNAYRDTAEPQGIGIYIFTLKYSDEKQTYYIADIEEYKY